eukprot:3195133-Prymnesium_polylepis.1
MAIAWAAQRPCNTSTIIGTTSVRQVRTGLCLTPLTAPQNSPGPSFLARHRLCLGPWPPLKSAQALPYMGCPPRTASAGARVRRR